MSKIILVNQTDDKNIVLDWELNEKNIEAHREEIDYYGDVAVYAFDSDGDILSECQFGCGDVADVLYDAIRQCQDIIRKYEDWCDEIHVCFTYVKPY